MDLEALEAVRRHARGVHVKWRGYVLEALDVHEYGSRTFVSTRHLDGSIGPTQDHVFFEALERDYEDADR